MSISLYEKSSTYRFIREIVKITQPLNNLGVTYFIYAELTPNNELCCLVNNDQMMRDFITYQGLRHEIALSPGKIIQEGMYFVSRLYQPPAVKKYYKALFNLHNTTDQLVYIQDVGKIRKVYMFGVLDPEYLNKEHVELFILYFNDKAYPFICNSEVFPLPKVTMYYKVTYQVMFVDELQLSAMVERFLHSINAKYYKIQQLKTYYNLSIRETQCLELILQNKIAKEIAELLQLTTRTVETYIENLKRKLNCRTKQEMMLKFFIK